MGGTQQPPAGRWGSEPFPSDSGGRPRLGVAFLETILEDEPWAGRLDRQRLGARDAHGLAHSSRRGSPTHPPEPSPAIVIQQSCVLGRMVSTVTPARLTPRVLRRDPRTLTGEIRAHRDRACRISEPRSVPTRVNVGEVVSEGAVTQFGPHRPGVAAREPCSWESRRSRRRCRRNPGPPIIISVAHNTEEEGLTHVRSEDIGRKPK